MAQLSHPYVIPGETIALTIQTFRRQSDVFVFLIYSKYIIAFLPRKSFNFMASITVRGDFEAQ